jgi:hypothetical protein
MAATPGGLPVPVPTDRPDVVGDLTALALGVEARTAGKGRVGEGSQGAAIESTVTDAPSPNASLGSFPVVTGRRYRLDVQGVLSDGSTTNVDGCGMWVSVVMAGAFVNNVSPAMRCSLRTRFTADTETRSHWQTFTPTTSGNVTVSVNVIRKGSNGRATLTGARALLTDLGPE